MVKKRDTPKIVHDFESTRKVRCKMTLKIEVNYWREIFSAMAVTLKKLKTSSVFSSFLVCFLCVRIEID